MQNVMIDLETLGTTADAVIMSIGAVEFELNGEIGRKFYRSVSIDSNLALDRKISESTLVWWLQQSAAAQRVFHEPKTPLETALVELVSWFPFHNDGRGNNSTLVWSNGASFDIPMLEHAFLSVDMKAPWEFYNSRCMRTYKNLPGAADVERPMPKVAHRADDDALAQALAVQAIHQALFGEVA